MPQFNFETGRILSLKWKVLIGLTFVLFGICGSFFWFYAETLEEQQRSEFNLMAQRFSNSLNHVLSNNTEVSQNLASTLTSEPNDIDALQALIIHLWPMLRDKWDIQSVVILESSQGIRFTYGRPISSVLSNSLAAIANQRAKPVSRFSCTSTVFDSNCSLITAIPIHTGSREGVMIIGKPITEVILKLSRANLIETAVLIRSQKSSGTSIDNWKLDLVAASDLDTAFNLLQATADETKLSQLVKFGVQIDAEKQRYYIKAISTEKIENSGDLLIVLIDNITAQYNALVEHRHQIIIYTLVAVVIAEMFVLFLLWHPMERIKWQAKVLPLLAEGDYHSVYSGPSYRNLRYRDELDILEDSSLSLARNLEKMSLEIRNRSKELERLVQRDPLTGLASRHSLDEVLVGAIDEYRRTNNGFALLFIDIDNFKRINDSLGHHIGDDLLVEIARRLRAITRSEDIVARLGGDEFIIILRNIKDANVAADIAHKIQCALHEPTTLEMRRLHISGSIGIALAPTDGLDPGTLMKNADLAMYRAKALGRNTYQFFTSLIGDSANLMLDLEIEIEQALKKNQFALFYQPIVNLNNRNIVGLEALVRWQHPERGIVAPSEFIPLMEQNGTIDQLDRKVIAMACRDVAILHAQTGLDLTVSVNLSPNELRDETLVTFLQDQIAFAGIEPNHLKLEITESVLMTNIEETAIALKSLKAIGIKLSIDDFGTGYSSLNYLKKLPVDELKVDRSFICDIPSDSSSMEIAAAVIAMAHKLNLSVVAEGIENEEQLAFLTHCQCDFGQGYYFERPLARDNIIEWLDQSDANPALRLVSYS